MKAFQLSKSGHQPLYRSRYWKTVWSAIFVIGAESLMLWNFGTPEIMSVHLCH